jgi:hypothetical protein
MKSTYFLIFSFLILAVLLLIFTGVFLFNNSKKEISTKNANVGSDKTDLNENKEKENTKEKVFNPLNLKWEFSGNALWAKRDAHTALVFKDKIWVFGGVGGNAPDYTKNYSDIWNSQDGKTWSQVTNKALWGPRRAHQSVIFKDKIFILGGVTTGEVYLNDVWFSSDGKDWIQIQKNSGWTPRKGFGSVVFQDKLWVMGGVDSKGAQNDVWYSEDGISWVLVKAHAPWRERYDLTLEVFDGKMWLSGGVFPGELGEKEVWYTEDGFNWQKTEGEIPWPGRHGHCFLSYKGYLWIIGGWSGYGHGYNDVWYSKDGIIWNQLYKDNFSPWEGREDLVCLDFLGKIFMMGGMKTNGERTNDVWYLNEE